MTDEKYEFAFMPWLTLPEEVAVGGVKFRTRSRFDEHQVLGQWDNAILKRLSTFKSFSGDPRDGWVVVEVDGDIVWPADSPALLEIRERVWAAAEVLALACIDCNEPFERFGQHAHSSLFRPRFQQMGPGGGFIMFNQHTKFGDRGHGWGAETIQHEPLHCHAVGIHALNKPLLNALEPLQKPEVQVSDDLLRLKRAIHLYLLGYSEDPSRTQEDDCAQVVGAIEALLSDDGKKGVANALCTLLNFPLDAKSRPRSKRLARCDASTDDRDPDKPILWNWYVDAYKHRNKYRHRGMRAVPNALWTLREHNQFATLVFPLIAKYELARLEHYSLTDDDRVFRDAIPELLDRGRFDEVAEDSTVSTNWSVAQLMSLVRKAHPNHPDA